MCDHRMAQCWSLFTCSSVNPSLRDSALTGNDVLRVSRERTVPHPTSGRLSWVVALDAELCHQWEIGCPPDFTGLICWASGQQAEEEKEKKTRSATKEQEGIHFPSTVDSAAINKSCLKVIILIHFFSCKYIILGGNNDYRKNSKAPMLLDKQICFYYESIFKLHGSYLPSCLIFCHGFCHAAYHAPVSRLYVMRYVQAGDMQGKCGEVCRKDIAE